MFYKKPLKEENIMKKALPLIMAALVAASLASDNSGTGGDDYSGTGRDDEGRDKSRGDNRGAYGSQGRTDYHECGIYA